MKEYEIVIIGGGPAGISAGIYAIRAGAKTLVFDNGNSSLEKTKIIQNYYGIESISGSELKQRGINQYKKLGGEIRLQEVVGVVKDFDADRFVVKTAEEEYVCRAVILCMGAGKKKTLEGLEKYEGENVSYCAVCDGFFYKGKTVAVVGNGNFALNEADLLSKVAKKVYILTNSGEKTAKKRKNVSIIGEKIANFVGKTRIERVVFEDNSYIDIDGVFVALGTLSGVEIAKQLGIITKNNCIIVDKNFMTNVAGAFCAGDNIGGLLQVVKAVSDGAQAGLEAVRYIKMLEMK